MREEKYCSLLPLAGEQRAMRGESAGSLAPLAGSKGYAESGLFGAIFWPLPFRERPSAYLDARFFFRTTAVRLGR